MNTMWILILIQNNEYYGAHHTKRISRNIQSKQGMLCSLSMGPTITQRESPELVMDCIWPDVVVVVGMSLNISDMLSSGLDKCT